ncbi:MAG: DNA primase [Pygmaiobacter massiliensis]|nr:DNA primase [Pygmaiobacter massiliensis]
MISQDYLQELAQRTDLVELVSGYVKLRHRGRTYTGLCPFHSEKTPSFVVYPENQSFYCFGCGVGGDAITFVKKIQNVDYLEAVKTLAARAGMPLPEEKDDTSRLKSRILAMNKDAARFYCAQLNTPEGMQARGYLRARALQDATIRRFGLGYSPAGFHTTSDYLQKKGYTQQEMLAGGMIRQSQKGGYFDFFRGRVMFPIIDLRGNVIAFGGRRMGEEGGPKYLNSGDTPVFKKSRNMFALNLAKRSKSRRYILCEGYMDAIALHQAGFDTAVAPLGTAFTPEQARLLSTYADELVLSYDSDEAGQKATRRAIAILEQESIKVSVLGITGAKDPDEFLKKYGAERFSMLLDGCSNAIEYELSRAKAKYDLATADGRLSYVREAIGVLCGRCTPTERDVYIGRLSQETDISRQALSSQLQSALRQLNRRDERKRQQQLLSEGSVGRVKVPYSQGGQKAMGVAFAEQQLMAAAIKKPEFLPYILKKLSAQQLLSQQIAQIYTAVGQLYEQGQYVDFSALSQCLTDETRTLLSRILAQNYDVAFTQRDVDFYLDKIAQSVPRSSQAGKMSEAELSDYLDKLKQKKLKGNHNG